MKINFKQISKVLEGNFPKIINEIILNFQYQNSNMLYGVNVFCKSLMLYATLYETLNTLSNLGHVYLNSVIIGSGEFVIIGSGGIALIALGITGVCMWIYEYFKSNKSKINDLFKPIRNEVKKYKKDIFLKFEKNKNNFISKLDEFQEFSEKEIKYLNENKFQTNFKSFIGSIKDEINNGN